MADVDAFNLWVPALFGYLGQTLTAAFGFAAAHYCFRLIARS